DIGAAMAAGFASGFGAAWASGLASRQFDIDGYVGAGNKVTGTKAGDILAYQSEKNDLLSLMVSTIDGGYSHVSTVDGNGNIIQYGGRADYNMSGRGYKIIGNGGKGYDLTSMRLNPDSAGYLKNKDHYAKWNNNCTTTLTDSFSAARAWTPAHYRYHNQFYGGPTNVYNRYW
ncbi:MAG TPA: hypothetical protein PKI36_15800, partial [Turneriella sp.]|nr:hypothetical protein [Turneriella sp.]